MVKERTAIEFPIFIAVLVVFGFSRMARILVSENWQKAAFGWLPRSIYLSRELTSKITPSDEVFCFEVNPSPYFAVVKTIRDKNKNLLPAEKLEEWTKVKFPLALVVFGEIEP